MPEKIIETLSWKGYNFTVKPFTLDTWYAYCEGVANSKESGRIIRGSFESNCQSLLQGVTRDDQNFLSTGMLAKSVLTSEDYKSAVAFKKQLDFLSAAFAEKADPETQSEDDSTDPSPVEKVQKASPRKSPKGTKEEPAHSG